MRHVLISTDAVGGVWTYSLALARGLVAGGTPCTLAVLGPPPDAAQASAARTAGCALVATGLQLDWTVDSRPALDAIAAGLLAVAQDCGAAAAHLHAPCLATAAWTLPTVAVAHSCMATWWEAVHGGPPPPTIAWHAAATAEGLQRATRGVAPSAAFAEALRRCYQPARPIAVIHNGVAAPPAGPAAREDFVLTAGRLWDEGKNMAVLDQAAGMMRTPVLAAGPLNAPGGTPAASRHLTLLGRLDPRALAAAMARAAAFAAPSRYEPFGLAVAEAALLGTPLVLADIPTFRELWNGAALFVPANDAAAWATTLQALVDDPPRRAALGAAAQARAQRYSLAAMVEATAALHADLPPAAQLAA